MLMQSISIDAMNIFDLSDLINHFHMHEENYNDDFASFIAKHYGSSHTDHDMEVKNSDQHQHEHQNLPIEHDIHKGYTFIACFINNTNSIQNSTEIIIERNSFYYVEKHHSSGVIGILDPPKINHI